MFDVVLCHHHTVCGAAEQPPAPRQQMSPARNLLGPALGPLHHHTNMMKLSRGEHGSHLLSAQLGPFPGDNIISQISLQPVQYLESVNRLELVLHTILRLFTNKLKCLKKTLLSNFFILYD